MLDPFVHPNHLRAVTTYSAVSRIAAPPDTYEIHLVKASDPEYVPPDMELWPLYHQTILLALKHFPDAHQAAITAVEAMQERIKGQRNGAFPPGTQFPY